MAQSLFTSGKILSHTYLRQGVRAAVMAFLTCTALFLLLVTFKFGIIL